MPLPPKLTFARLVFLFTWFGIFTFLPGCAGRPQGSHPQYPGPLASSTPGFSWQPSITRSVRATVGVSPGKDPGATSIPLEAREPSPPSGGSLEPVDAGWLPGKIVFTCKPERYNQLCLMNGDGSGWTLLTDRQADDFYPALSPDGESVVFTSNRSGRSEITLRSLASGVERKLTDGLGEVTAPQISPDGQWVVFTNRLGGADPSIWKMQIHGSLPRPLGDEPGSHFDPAWSPDGAQIAFALERGGYVELYVMDAGGEDPHKVSEGIAQIGGIGSWSPDGSSLAFYAGPRGDRDIYLLEIASGRVRRLTFGGNNSGPSFSPDGAWLVFSSSRDGDHEIFVMRVDGSEVTQLTDNRFDDWQPNWGP